MNEETETFPSLAEHNPYLPVFPPLKYLDNRKEHPDGTLMEHPELALGSSYKEGDTGFTEHSVLPPSAAGVPPNSLPGSIPLPYTSAHLL